MLKEILNVLEPTIISILGIVISSLGAIAVSYIKTKRDSVVAKIGQDQYNHRIKVAEDVFNFVDEEFRVNGIVGKAIDNKIAMFNAELLKRIPGLTQAQIDSLRQTIAGQVNKGREVILSEGTQTEQAVSNEVQPIVAP